MTDPGVQHPIIPAAQTPIIGITVDLVAPCKVVLFDILREFFLLKRNSILHGLNMHLFQCVCIPLLDSSCDVRCGCGFKHISFDLNGEGKSWSNTRKGIDICAYTCRQRDGCTGFEYNNDGSENYKCGTYTGGDSNIEATVQSSSWTSCVQGRY